MTSLCVGTVVTLHGLQTATLNGRRGAVCYPQLGTSGRWPVTLDDGAEIDVAEANLAVAISRDPPPYSLTDAVTHTLT